MDRKLKLVPPTSLPKKKGRPRKPPPPPPWTSDFLTIEMVSERWHCGLATVYHNWRSWGLKGTKFGKRLLFSLESIEAVERKRAGKK